MLLMGKSTISMAIFNSYLYMFTRPGKLNWFRGFVDPSWFDLRGFHHSGSNGGRELGVGVALSVRCPGS